MTDQPDKQFNKPTSPADKAEQPDTKPAVDKKPDEAATGAAQAGKPPEAAQTSAEAAEKKQPANGGEPARPPAASAPRTESPALQAKKPDADKNEAKPAGNDAKPVEKTDAKPAADQAEPAPQTEKSAGKPPAEETAAGISTAPVTDALAAPAKPAASAGIICPSCGHRNRPGLLLCENCGTNLMTGKQTQVGTRDLKREQETADQEGARLLDTGQTKAIESAGGSAFTENMVLRVEIEGAAMPMLVYPKAEIILGRRDPNTGAMPDVDLTAYAGYRMGVSRRHAAIRFQDRQLNLSDLGSSNGTFLNGTRLNAHRPYQLRDGDEIRLGQMVLRLFFQASGRK